MTDNSAFKKQVRARMAETDEKYTEARRKILAGSGPRRSPLPPTTAIDLSPGTFTAILGGGGMTNLALVMPHLVNLAHKGHPVLIAAHEGRASMWNLGSPLDFLAAAGVITPQEIAEHLASKSEEERRHLASLLADFPMTFAGGPQPAIAWEDQLSAQDSKHAVLYVPDLNVDLPLSDWPPAGTRRSLSSVDMMPAQLAGLRSVARRAEAAVVGGSVDSWDLVADLADARIVLKDDMHSDENGMRQAELEFHSRWSEDPGPLRREHTTLDLGFDRWRFLLAEENAA